MNRGEIRHVACTGESSAPSNGLVDEHEAHIGQSTGAFGRNPGAAGAPERMIRRGSERESVVARAHGNGSPNGR
jgi:hypothetical protein